MPYAFRVYLDLEGSSTPAPEHLRGFASNVFEEGIDTDHHAHIKPYTVGKFALVAGTTWALDVTAGSDRLAGVLVERLKPGGRVVLGPLSGIVAAEPVVLLSRPWGDLANAPPISGLQLSFDTPVIFVRQKGQHAHPTGKLVFGHLRRRWRHLDPDTAPDVSFDGIDFGVDLKGTRIVVRGAGSTDPDTGQSTGRRAAGFIGVATISITGATRGERFALGALAGAVPFLGSGAWTTSGFGATSLLVMWADE